ASASVTPSARNDATTPRPCRRSAMCIESKRASWGGAVQVASAECSSGVTRARRCIRNWRTLPAHQEREEAIDDREEEAAADGVTGREEEERDDDQEAVLLEHR